MARYRKIPQVIDAEQWDGSLEGARRLRLHIVYPSNGKPFEVYVRTQEGNMRVRPRNWIITGVQGERYACDDSIFRETYERVED